MSGRYLTDLADVVRRAGLAVVEVDGWKSRARGSGGYSSGRPTHVMCHHTASGASSDGWPDVNYIATGSGDAPLSNLYLNRGGSVWVIAAGATNTNGQGGPIDGVPANSMNTYAVGIEAGNNGTGEAWPGAQQDAYLVLVRALCDAYAIPYVRAHFEWAPGRKVDPAGPSRWSKPSGGGSANMWRMDQFRADLASATAEGGEDSIMVYSPERVDVVAIGTDRAVWLKTYWPASGWTEWSSLGGEATAISACWSGDQFNVFATGPSGACYQNAWSPAAPWTGWVDLGAPSGGLAGGIGATTRYTPDDA